MLKYYSKYHQNCRDMFTIQYTCDRRNCCFLEYLPVAMSKYKKEHNIMNIDLNMRREFSEISHLLCF